MDFVKRIMSFTATIVVPAATGSAAYNFQFNPKLSDFSGYNPLRTIFEAYKISKIWCKFIPLVNTSYLEKSTDNNSGELPIIKTTITDRITGSISTAADFDAFRYMTHRANQIFTRHFKPCVQDVYASGEPPILSALHNGPKRSPWLNTDNGGEGIPHVGLAGQVESVGPAESFNISVVIKAIVMFKKWKNSSES